MVTLRHVFGLPDLTRKDLGTLLYRRVPWAIYRRGDSFIYVGISPDSEITKPRRVAVFDADFGHGIIYSPPSEATAVRCRGFSSLTLFPTDQILVGQLLAQRRGCYIHAAGVIMEGQGLLLVGHSDGALHRDSHAERPGRNSL